MGTIKRIEKRRRGIFGWFFITLFWGFNLLMAAGLFSALSQSSQTMAGYATEAERMGHAAGTVLGVGMIVTLWAIGAALLGLFALMTRGSKVIVETTED